jgi:hypothetical protein
MSLRHLLFLPALLALPGCLATQSGSLEVLNPKQAYGQSLAVVSDLHRENEAIEKRLASDLQAALSKHGLTLSDDPKKAGLVVVPTLGRMRDKPAAPVAPAQNPAVADGNPAVEASEPVVAAPAPEARSFNRFSGGNILTRTDLVSRRAVPSARVPANAQQAGLLLTAYRSEDFLDYGVGRQSLPPVWRIYVSQPATQMKWNSVAMPLINAAASAAKPLAKSKDVQNAERKVKKQQTESRVAGSESRESRAERTADGPKANRLESSDSRAAGSPSGEINTKDPTANQPKDEEPEKKKRPVFRFFGRPVEQTE